MAHGAMTPPEIDQSEPGTHTVTPRVNDSTTARRDMVRPVDFTFRDTTLKEEGVLSSLVSSVRDTFFAPKLPPLELESKPIAVVDRMAVKRDPVPAAISTIVNGLIVLVIIFFAARQVIKVTPPKQEITSISAPVPPIKLPPSARKAGGGGGQKSLAPVAKGTPPPPSPVQLAPPKAPPTTPPKIAVQNTLDIDKNLHMTSNVPTIGLPNATAVGVGGLGRGNGAGLGDGNGNGAGPGSGGNTGGGVRRVGGRVTAPVPIYTVEPEFSEEARKTKTFGNVVVNIIVNEQGKVTRVRVISEPGQGLGQKAIEAVRQFRFKPATEDGKAVPVELNYEVNFQIF